MRLNFVEELTRSRTTAGGGRRSPRAMEGKGADNFHLRPHHRVHLHACELPCVRARDDATQVSRTRATVALARGIHVHTPS